MTRACLGTIAALALLLALVGCEDECQSPVAEAEALIASYAGCAVDEDCEVVNLYDIGLGSQTCIAAFQCDVALSVDADHDQLAAEAQAIADEWLECGECATVECTAWEFEGTPVGACNAATSTCEIEVIPL